MTIHPNTFTIKFHYSDVRFYHNKPFVWDRKYSFSILTLTESYHLLWWFRYLTNHQTSYLAMFLAISQSHQISYLVCVVICHVWDIARVYQSCWQYVISHTYHGSSYRHALVEKPWYSCWSREYRNNQLQYHCLLPLTVCQLSRYSLDKVRLSSSLGLITSQTPITVDSKQLSELSFMIGLQRQSHVNSWLTPEL